MTSEAFIRYFIVPLFTIGIVVLLKVLSRKKDGNVTNEDKSVGVEILIGNISVLFIEIVDRLQKVSSGTIDTLNNVLPLLYAIAIFSGISLLTSYLIRMYGWNGNAKKPMLKKWAVNWPNIIGAVSQGIVLYLLTKN